MAKGRTAKGRIASVIYFDACVYLAFLANETSYGKDRIDAIKDAWDDNRAGGCSIITSSLSICEVTECLLVRGMKAELEEFRLCFSNGLHTAIDVDPPIAEKAGRYRHYYHKHPLKHPDKPTPFSNLTTADAVHCATAVIHKARELWTFDGLGKKNDKQKSIKLLWLNNRVGDDDLIITSPSQPQLRLL